MDNTIKVTKALKTLNPEALKDALVGATVATQGLILQKGGAPIDHGAVGSNSNSSNTGGSLGASSLTPPSAKGGKIEVDAGLLRELIESNKALQKKVDKLDSNAVVTGPNGIQVRRKTKDFDYTLRKWDDKIVMGFENMGNEKRPLYVYNIYDTGLRMQVQFVNIILEGGEKVEKLNYIDFLRDAERIKARRVSQVEHEEILEYGMIPKKEMAENGYGMFETMVMIPVEVTSKTYTLTLRLPNEKNPGVFDGREIVIEDKWVNM